MSVVDNAIYVDGRRKLTPASLDTAFDALRSCPDDGHSFAWIGMLRPGTDEIEAVAREFDLHELAVEDTVNAHQRPKLERYGATTFVVLRPARYVGPVEVITLGEVHLFLGPQFAITVRHADEPNLAVVRKCLEGNRSCSRTGPTGCSEGYSTASSTTTYPCCRGSVGCCTNITRSREVCSGSGTTGLRHVMVRRSLKWIRAEMDRSRLYPLPGTAHRRRRGRHHGQRGGSRFLPATGYR